MTTTDGHRQNLAAADPGRPGTAAARVVVALAVAFAFGAIDQYLPVVVPMSHLRAYQFVVQVSNGMAAPWLLVPFLAGAWQTSGRRAALVGLAATWLSVLAYVLMIVSPMEGGHLALRGFLFSLGSQWPWFAGGLITGPLFGWYGHRWRARHAPAVSLLVALPILLEPGARWLATVMGLDNVPWITFRWPPDGGGITAEFTELAVGLLLTCAAIIAVVRAGSESAIQSAGIDAPRLIDL